MPAFIDPVEKIIRKRRSIRKYKPDMPPPGWIDSAVSCAAMAPSPSNSQPVRFVRISSGQILDRLKQTMEARRREFLEILSTKAGAKKTRNLINAYYRYSEFLFNAPVIIAAGTIQTNTFSGKLVEAGILTEDTRGETDQDITVGLALKGLILKCEALGLGTCILTAPLAFLPDVEKTLGLDDIRVKCFVTMGFPDETPSTVDKKSASEIYREI